MWRILVSFLIFSFFSQSLYAQSDREVDCLELNTVQRSNGKRYKYTITDESGYLTLLEKNKNNIVLKQTAISNHLKYSQIVEGHNQIGSNIRYFTVNPRDLMLTVSYRSGASRGDGEIFNTIENEWVDVNCWRFY